MGPPILPKLSSATADERQAVMVTIRLCSGEMGDKAERERIIALDTRYLMPLRTLPLESSMGTSMVVENAQSTYTAPARNDCLLWCGHS